jgi:hypothetical protein
LELVRNQIIAIQAQNRVLQVCQPSPSPWNTSLTCLECARGRWLRSVWIPVSTN